MGGQKASAQGSSECNAASGQEQALSLVRAIPYE
jgi:hypothetical protein